MIQILCGTDIKKRSLAIEKLIHNRDVTRLSSEEVSKTSIITYAQSVDLFGSSPVIIIDGIISEGAIVFSAKELISLQESKTLFIFLENKIKASDEKKYAKYATIEFFEEKKAIQTAKINTFAIVDSFARHDKVATWVLYCEAIEKGTEPEALSGMLFWKIKNMLINGTKSFSPQELRQQSSQIVSLYHKAHRGECDFVVGLEQFILTSLS